MTSFSIQFTTDTQNAGFITKRSILQTRLDSRLNYRSLFTWRNYVDSQDPSLVCLPDIEVRVQAYFLTWLEKGTFDFPASGHHTNITQMLVILYNYGLSHGLTQLHNDAISAIVADTQAAGGLTQEKNAAITNNTNQGCSLQIALSQYLHPAAPTQAPSTHPPGQQLAFRFALANNLRTTSYTVPIDNEDIEMED
ncbi:hypothetical protein BDV96DRAFT_688823 [Lophiotrema nucula]|uniref:Uncharacterized protein n=1 Tax=Lophiotrema nucula TaxID=690887 RepID=A0A6A5Z4H5_9PLEO|nr:hypothetical protein BDV96DRAFT_688823 [Lophiotrema nucula]